MRISDWSSDVCSSDLPAAPHQVRHGGVIAPAEHLGACRAAGGSRRSILPENQLAVVLEQAIQEGDAKARVGVSVGEVQQWASGTEIRHQAIPKIGRAHV